MATCMAATQRTFGGIDPGIYTGFDISGSCLVADRIDFVEPHCTGSDHRCAVDDHRYAR